MANDMNNPSTNAKSSGATVVLGYVAGVAAVIALLALAYIKIQNMPTVKGRDYGLLGVAIVGVLVWAFCNKDELIRLGSSRGTAMNVNALGNLVAVFGILLLANYYIVPRHLGDKKLDLTAGKYYSLSTQTKNIVKTIKSDNPIELVAFVPMDTYARISGDAARSLELNKKRLEEYKRLNPNLSVTTLDPYISKRATEIAKESGLTSLPQTGCILRFKKDPKAVETVSSLDESQITRSLSKLLEDKGKKRKVYILTGHGEIGLTASTPGNPQDPMGGGGESLAELKTTLEQDRFEVVELPVIKQAVPADCTVLITVGAKAPFLAGELAALRTWLSAGGRLFAVLDPEGKSNLGDLLKEYGLDWQPTIVDDQTLSDQGAPSLFYSKDFGTHPLVNDLKKARYVAVFNKTGYFKRGTVPTDMDYAELVKSSASSKAASANGPFDLVVTVATREKPADDPSKKDEKKDDKTPAAQANNGTRIVVAGTPSFLTLPLAGPVANPLIAADACNWLSDNTKDMGIRPKNPWDDEKERKIEMTTALRTKVLLFTFFLPLLLCLGAGIAVSVARSRR